MATFADFTVSTAPASTDHIIGYATAVAGGERRWTHQNLFKLDNTVAASGIVFGASGGTITGASGALTLAAAGTNQNITLTPSGTGVTVLGSGDLYMGSGVYVTPRRNSGNNLVQSYGFSGDNLQIVGSNIAGSYIAFSNTGINAAQMALHQSGNLTIGTTTDSSNGRLQLATHTTSAGGIGFGTDTPLFRSGAGALRLGTGATTSAIECDGGSGNVRAVSFMAAGSVTAQLGLFADSILRFRTNGSTDALTLDSSQNATFAGDVTVSGGNIGVGGAVEASASILSRSSSLTGTEQFGVNSSPVFSSQTTNVGVVVYGHFKTAAAAFTMGTGNVFQIETPSLGSGSAVTTLNGIKVGNLGSASVTNAYGIDIAAQSGAATTNVGLRNAGTSILTGAVTLGSSALSTSATGGIGYTTGAGGAVTQITSRTTGVTLNTVCGAITLVSAAGSTSWQTFTVTNSTVAATDTVIVNQKSGTDRNMIHVTAVAAGSFNISFATTGGTTTEQPVFNFAVIKAVAA